jgi:hypothetical protein
MPFKIPSKLKFKKKNDAKKKKPKLVKKYRTRHVLNEAGTSKRCTSTSSSSVDIRHDRLKTRLRPKRRIADISKKKSAQKSSDSGYHPDSEN